MQFLTLRHFDVESGCPASTWLREANPVDLSAELL
jgi:hypothetical protein